MKKGIYSALVCLIAVSACTNEFESESPTRTILKVELPSGTKTVLGDAEDGVRQVLWCKGDKIAVNGIESESLDIESTASSAEFAFVGEISAPYSVLYPSSMVKDAKTITFPSSQKAVNGDNIVSGSLPMAGYSEMMDVRMGQLCGILGVRLKAGTDTEIIRYIEVSSNGGEQLYGDFTVDFQECSLSPANETENQNVIRMEVQDELSGEGARVFNVILPAGTYSNGFTVKVVDENGQAMKKSISGSRELVAGKLMLMPVLTFEPNSVETGVEIATAEDWNAFATAYNAGEYPDSQIATITADLDFSSVSSDDFVTLGIRKGAKQFPENGKFRYFSGTLNGNGKKILNLKTDVPFVQAIGTAALVQDVNLDASCSFTVWYGDEQLEFGSLVGYCSEGALKNCTSNASVTVSQCNSFANTQPLYVGGLVGRNRAATITGCTSSVTISADDTYVADATSKPDLFIGGFTGYCSNPDGVLENSSNTGNISVASTALNIYVGGICARCSAGTISGCFNSGAINVSTVRASGDPCKFFYLGGLFGVIDTDATVSLKISDCSNAGDITSSSNVKQLIVGGIAAQLSTEVAEFSGNNTSSGRITTTAALRNLYCGGLFGRVTAARTLELSGEPCTGTISIGAAESGNNTYLYCGGLVGQTTAEVALSGGVKCKSNITYDISGADNQAAESYFGGIIGYASGAPIDLSGIEAEGTLQAVTAGKAMKHAISGWGGIIGGASKDVVIADCSSSVYVQMTAQTSKTNGCSVHFGGIAGRLYGGDVEVKNCANSGRLQNNHYNNNDWTAYTGDVAGGIVGSICYSADNTSNVIVENCQNTGKVYSYRGASGGIVGYVSNGTVANCSSTGDITRSAPGGGIAGIAENSKITGSYVKSDITGNSAGSTIAHIGGIIGEAVSSSVDGCRSLCVLKLESNSSESVGGIIGKADDASSAGVATSCGYGGTLAGNTITDDNVNDYAIGSTTGTRGTFYLWDGTI